MYFLARESHPQNPRRLMFGAIAALTLALLAGCVPAPVPTVTHAVKAQPPFTATPTSETSAEPASANSKTSSFAADYTTEDGIVDKSMLMNASQGGYAPMRNLNWFPGQYGQMTSMGLREIRIDHVFDDSYYHVVNVAANGATTYDFAGLDRAVLPLVANGMTPFFSLSYSPSASGKALYQAPKSTAAFAAATTALVSHYEGLGLSGLNYEVWNEIDSLYNYTGTIEEYETLYVATAAAVRAADSSAKIGGAATSTIGMVGGWSSRFLAWLTANPNVPADFFSYHSYYIDDFSDGPTAQSWLKATGRNIPIYITEWSKNPASGLGAGQGSDTNSSVSGSSYAAKRLFTAIGAGAAKIFWFSPLEGGSPNKPYLGDLGLITMDGHRKSVGNVFEMYSKLDTTRVAATVSGAGSEKQDVYGLITKNTTSKKTTVLLWNNTSSDSAMAMLLSQLPYAKTNFQVSESMVSNHKGNAFSDMSTAVDYRYPSPNENAPVVSDSVLSASTNFKKSIVVPANGIVELTLLPSSQSTGLVDIVAQPSSIDLAAAGAGATVTTSSSFAEIPAAGWGTANLIDGRRISVTWVGKGTEGWSSAAHATAEATESAQVDLGKAHAVDSMVLWPRNAAGSEGEGFPSDFTISGSADGTTWTTLRAVTDYHSKTPVIVPQTFDFAPGTYRYLKVVATKLARPTATNGVASFHFQLTEIEAYRAGLANGGFENSSIKPWKVTGTGKLQSEVVYAGGSALALSKSGSKATYAVGGLKENTTYTFGGYLKSSTDGSVMTIAATAGGKKAKPVAVESTSWRPAWVTFTTPKGTTTAVVSVAKGGPGTSWADNFTLTSKTGQ